MNRRHEHERPGKLIARAEKNLMRWPQVAAIIFPDIQKTFPEWRGKSLEDFIANWPMPVDLDGWVEVRDESADPAELN